MVSGALGYARSAAAEAEFALAWLAQVGINRTVELTASS
jgi:hypothetical protein